MVNSCILRLAASILSATGVLLLIHIWILPVFFGGYKTYFFAIVIFITLFIYNFIVFSSININNGIFGIICPVIFGIIAVLLSLLIFLFFVLNIQGS